MSTSSLLLKLNMPVVLQLSLAHACAPQVEHSLISTLTRRMTTPVHPCATEQRRDRFTYNTRENKVRIMRYPYPLRRLWKFNIEDRNVTYHTYLVYILVPVINKNRLSRQILYLVLDSVRIQHPSKSTQTSMLRA